MSFGSSAALLPFINDFQNSRYQLAAVVVSTVAYGVVFVLFGKCISLLYKARELQIYSIRMQWFLFSYTTFMFLTASATTVTEIYYLYFRVFGSGWKAWTNNFFILLDNNTPFTIPIAIWGADGFMLWRCLFLYRGVPPIARAALVCVLSLLSILSLGAGLLFLLPYTSRPLIASARHSNSPIVRFIVKLIFNDGQTAPAITLTPIVNTVLAGLIAGRILYHQKYIRQALGVGHGSVYTRIMAMCIESCGLIILTASAYVGLLYSLPAVQPLVVMQPVIAAQEFLLSILPHVCVISPFLIVFRVAEGRAASTVEPSEIEIGHLHFHNSQTIQGDEEDRQ